MSHEFPTPGTWADPEVLEPPPDRWRWWRRLWAGARATLRRLAPASEEEPLSAPEPVHMPEWLDMHEPNDEYTFETPAMGDAFNFLIKIRCSWCVQATASPEEKERKTVEIRGFIERSRPAIQDRIQEHVRGIARQFPPYRAAEAENALRERLSDCLSDGDVRVTAQTWVDVCDPVREDLQKVWQHRLMVDADGDLKKAHVELLGELEEAWRKLLIKGLEGMGAMSEAKTGWLAPYALALAENPKHAPAYLQDVLEKRVDHAERLLTDLGALAIDNRFEAIEFAFQSESALRALLVYLGVPIPSQDGPETAGAWSAPGGDADV